MSINPDEKFPELAPTTLDIDDFWFKAYPGLTIWTATLYIEIDQTGDWYLERFVVFDDDKRRVVTMEDPLFALFSWELDHNEDLQKDIHEACIEAGRAG